MSSTHDGHRDRVKRQFLAEGFSENTPPHKLLEMLLFYCVPRKDTNELAHNLLDTFGSFSGVLDASKEDLMRFPGITENGVCLLKAIMPSARLYNETKNFTSKCFSNRQLAADYLANKFMGRTYETVFLLCLNNKGKLLSCNKISEGDDISVSISARIVIEEVFKTGATAVLLGHNHPKGFAFPSPSDIKSTMDIARALFNVGVRLLDHIIVADGDYISLAESKEYNSIFDIFN